MARVLKMPNSVKTPDVEHVLSPRNTGPEPCGVQSSTIVELIEFIAITSDNKSSDNE